MQALDGLGLITAISAPVTAAIGGVRFIWIYIVFIKQIISFFCIKILNLIILLLLLKANVKAIENARVINQQSLIQVFFEKFYLFLI